MEFRIPDTTSISRVCARYAYSSFSSIVDRILYFLKKNSANVMLSVGSFSMCLTICVWPAGSSIIQDQCQWFAFITEMVFKPSSTRHLQGSKLTRKAEVERSDNRARRISNPWNWFSRILGLARVLLTIRHMRSTFCQPNKNCHCGERLP